MSIFLPHLASDRIARLKWGRSWLSNGRPEAPPIVVTARQKNTVRIIAHEADGARHGFFSGQPLGDARALMPSLECHEQDVEADAALLAAIATWCDRYTPLVAIDGGDGLLLDISGCAHLFGGEAPLLQDIETRLRLQGLQARSCVADTAGAAWAMTHYGKARQVAPGDSEPVLSLPLGSLRIDAETVAGLARVGLRTVGCIAYMPRAPLAARFGEALLERLDQALGREEEALSPRLPVPPLMSEKRFNEPIVHEDDIRRTILLLAQNAVPRLEQRGLGARVLALKLFRTDGEVLSLTVHAANPLRAPERMRALFDERLAALADEFDAGFGFDLLRLDIVEADPFDAAQGDMLSRTANGDGAVALIDRLGARLGPERVRAFAYADTHIPERRSGLIPVIRHRGGDPAPQPGGDTATRPIFLLARPEPLEVIAEVPDGPPIRFRWRKVPYAVLRSEGPERIACEWWCDGRGALTRDYFRIEDENGYRFWLFRHGLYERETARPRWFMHGLFA
ncbi:MAG: DNA polymerase Y family protein [Flavobacteriaceae bacterium]